MDANSGKSEMLSGYAVPLVENKDRLSQQPQQTKYQSVCQELAKESFKCLENSLGARSKCEGK